MFPDFKTMAHVAVIIPVSNVATEHRFIQSFQTGEMFIIEAAILKLLNKLKKKC